MRKITKNPEQLGLKDFYSWKKNHPQAEYAKLQKLEKAGLKAVLLAEQFYLCAYCCNEVGQDGSSNIDHVRPQKNAPEAQLDYENLVVSCTTKSQCNQSKKDKDLPITPLQDVCETSFKFHISGEVTGNTKAANGTINILKLGCKNENKALQNLRQKQIQSFAFEDGRAVSKDEMVSLLQASTEKMLPFQPILQQLLDTGAFD